MRNEPRSRIAISLFYFAHRFVFFSRNGPFFLLDPYGSGCTACISLVTTSMKKLCLKVFLLVPTSACIYPSSAPSRTYFIVKINLIFKVLGLL